MQLLVNHGASAPKEPAEKKHVPKKAPEKKKAPERNEIKKYALAILKDGEWKQANPEEVKSFMETNKEFSRYFSDPNMLRAMQTPEIPPSVIIYDHWEKVARKIIAHLWKMHGAWNFYVPVNAIELNIPDYHIIIQHPMDLGTIKQKLGKYIYKNSKEFVDDVELVFANCFKYNGELHTISKIGKNMLEEFRNQCKSYYFDYYM